MVEPVGRFEAIQVGDCVALRHKSGTDLFNFLVLEKTEFEARILVVKGTPEPDDDYRTFGFGERFTYGQMLTVGRNVLMFTSEEFEIDIFSGTDSVDTHG